MDANAELPSSLRQLFEHGVKLLETRPQFIACPQIARMLCGLLTQRHVATEIVPNVNRRTLYEKIGGLTILGHHHPESVSSEPHDHGRTWALYGVVTGKTAMYEYDIIEPAKDGNKGKVKLANSYWIMPGQACCYPVGVVHSHKTYDDSRLIRIEGINIWRKELKPGGHKYEMIL